jgi:hypothetical protein
MDLNEKSIMEQNNINEEIGVMTSSLEKLSTEERKEDDITPSNLQTKTWRTNCCWYQGGKRNQCEKYQVEQIHMITGIISSKTHMRINADAKYIMQEVSNPMSRDDGFYWTENFDRILLKDNIKFHINLKMICGPGGGQNRSLSEVSNFIICQLEYLMRHDVDNVYFLNILDGDASYAKMRQFPYILNKEIYNSKKRFIFIGDMYTFRNEWDMTYKHIM